MSELWQTDFTHFKVAGLGWYYLPSEVKEHLQRFINYNIHERYHESLDNLTPADVYYGRDRRC